MLVLTRRTDEVLWIGDNIQLVVVSVKGESVRLGIVAPSEVRVDRDEVRRRINGLVPVASSGHQAENPLSHQLPASP
jgi:carbon storage regulator